MRLTATSASLGELSLGIGYAKASCCFFGVLDLSEIFREIHSTGQDQPHVRNTLYKGFRPVCDLGCTGSQGIPREGELDGDSYLVLACICILGGEGLIRGTKRGPSAGSVRGRGALSKGTMASDSTSESCPCSPCPVEPGNSIPPCMSLAISNCCPNTGIQRVSLCKSVCGLLKQIPGDSSNLQLTQPQSVLVFTARSYGTSLPSTGDLGWVTRCAARSP